MPRKKSGGKRKLESFKKSTIVSKARKRGIAISGKNKAQLIRKMRGKK